MGLRLPIVLLALVAMLGADPSTAPAAEPCGAVYGTLCPPRTLTVPLFGNGSGTVTSAPAGINCVLTKGVKSGTCAYAFEAPISGAPNSVTLAYTPAPGSLCQYSNLVGPQASPCGIAIGFSSDREAYDAYFILSTHTLTVSRTGAGTGKVTSSPTGIDCGSTCSKAFDYETKVTLTATPDAGAVFKAWTGACAGQGAACTLTITEATSTNAVFELPAADGDTTGGA